MKIPTDMTSGTIHKSKRYGELSIINYINCYNVTVVFLSTGFTATFDAQRIRTGAVKDKFLPIAYGVGFVGVGDHKTGFKGVHTKAHNTWKMMLARCYDDETQKKHPTYKGVTVCNEWHNFQYFAEWFDLNYVKGYQIDKDIKQRGIAAKIYSPETCLFVSSGENINESHAKSCVFNSPHGETVTIYNLTKFCRDNGLTQANMHKVLSGERPHHKGWTKP